MQGENKKCVEAILHTSNIRDENCHFKKDQKMNVSNFKMFQYTETYLHFLQKYSVY